MEAAALAARLEESRALVHRIRNVTPDEAELILKSRTELALIAYAHNEGRPAAAEFAYQLADLLVAGASPRG